MRQVKVSRTLVFGAPRRARAFFEALIADNLDIGRPANVEIIFNRHIRRDTPGVFRTAIDRPTVGPDTGGRTPWTWGFNSLGVGRLTHIGAGPASSSALPGRALFSRLPHGAYGCPRWAVVVPGGGWRAMGAAMAGSRGTGVPFGDGRAGGGGGWRVVVLVVAVVASAAVAAGCGGAQAGGAPRYEVLARAIPGLGKVITDGRGFTLYMYVPDRRGVSRCAGVCAEQWPPLVLPRGVTRPRAGPGVRAALLGTVRRGGGALQETYNGWPLYLWQGDTLPGQATGQGEGMGLWYTVAATGAVDKGTPS